MPAGSRVLVVARAADAVSSRLEDRNCGVVSVSSLHEALATSSETPFDAIVLLDGFEDLADPVDALRALAKLLGETGSLVVVAQNATHASVRLQALLADADAGSLPARRYDLPTLERVVREAGLDVAERLRVIEPVPAATLDAVASGLSAVITGAEVATRTFVLVVGRGDGNRDAENVTDAMARRLAELTAQVAELDAVRNRLAVAEETIADQTIELDARRDALAERVELIERLYAERRHLELEIVVKDDYISILRRDRNDWRNLHAAVQYELDDLRRSRHYKVAAGMHAALQRVPVLPRLARWAARRLMAARGRA